MIYTDGFKPWEKRVLVKPLPKRERKDSPILIADTVVSQGEEGEVIAVGEKCENAKPGQKVIYPTNAGWELELKGEKMRVVQEIEIEGEVE